MKASKYLLAALAAAFLLTCAPASAATQAQCEQQYAAKKAAGQTGPKSKAAFVKACLAAADPKPAGAAASPGGADANKLREGAENPVADLYSVQFQNNLNFGFGPHNAAQDDLNFQPVIPIHLNDEWNIIARPITPILYQPRLAPDLGPEFGLGNIEPEIFLSPAHPGKLIWGVGPALYLPTATNQTLGVNAWGAGPGVVGLTIQEPWVVGVVANNVWAWRNGQQVDADDRSVFHQLQPAGGLVSQFAADHHRGLARAGARQVDRSVRRRRRAPVQGGWPASDQRAASRRSTTPSGRRLARSPARRGSCASRSPSYSPPAINDQDE